jgi:hypothetical protein
MEKRKRKAINAVFISSSENYEQHHQSHLASLQLNHELNKEVLEKVEKIPYTPCFGKWVEVPRDKVQEFKEQGINIIYK